MFEVGDRVVRKSTEQAGFVHGVRKNKTLMIEVRWDASGLKIWLPAEEFRVWDKAEVPPPARITSWGRTTPLYLQLLGKAARSKAKRSRIAKWNPEAAADKLLQLSAKGNKGRNKARKLIAKIERESGR